MADWLFRFLKGAIIGIGAILPESAAAYCASYWACISP